VARCLAEECSYNCDDACHASSVHVGDAHPACDTFTVSAANICEGEGHVTRCLIEECAFNTAEACTATSVSVGPHSAHADCGTFRPSA
jgi:hypothetical protein